MKLCYYKLPNGAKNFGDDLNPWLWERLLPGVIDADERTAFVGIGTLINEVLPYRTRMATKRVIFGTGVGYINGSFALDESYTIYCLRGPLSAQALGVSSHLAVTDGAMLVRRFVEPSSRKQYQFGYMPHYELAGKAWETVCQQLGYAYIDPRWSVEEVLSRMNQTEVLLTEAMHGAIVAEALRVPWIPIVTNPSILSFKWQDWCKSIGVDYQPTYMPRLHHPRQKRDVLSPVRGLRDWVRQKDAASKLAHIAKTVRPTLGNDIHIEQLTHLLEERLHQFKDDVALGQFAV